MKLRAQKETYRNVRAGDFIASSEGSPVWCRIAAVTSGTETIVVFEDYSTRVLSPDGRPGMNPDWFDILRPEL